MAKLKSIAVDGQLKRCKTCSQDKPLNAYSVIKSGKYGVTSVCKACHNTAQKLRWQSDPERRALGRKCGKQWNTNNAEQKRHLAHKSHIKCTYGIAWDAYLAMCARQKNCCAICKRNTRLIVDHDHATNVIRGLICHRCNTGLGMFQDSAQLLRRANGYLTKNTPTAKAVRQTNDPGLFDSPVYDRGRIQ